MKMIEQIKAALWELTGPLYGPIFFSGCAVGVLIMTFVASVIVWVMGGA